MSKARVSAFFVVAGIIMALMASSPAWAALLKAADWQMDETSGPMLDTSGNGNDGTPTNLKDRTGSTDVFDGSSSLVTVPSSDSLNPGGANITLTLVAKFTKPPDAAVGDYDLIRKGLSSTSGGEYKMEILPRKNYTKAKAFCYFKDSSKKVGKIINGPNLADGTWHTLSCTKTSEYVQLSVDGKNYTNQVVLGSISNSGPLTIGAKTGGGDWYSGDMDEVSVETF
jgi:hypothetical protein